MAAKRHDFLSRAGADQLTRDVTRFFAPQINGKAGFVKLESDGRVVRVDNDSTAKLVRQHTGKKGDKYVIVQPKKRSRAEKLYMNAVKSLAGFKD